MKRLLYNLTKEEGTNLPRAVYNLSRAMQNFGIEPVDYNHLPEHGVYKGLVEAIITVATIRREMPRHPSQHREEEIETWIEGLGVDESKAADLATHDDTEDDIDAAPHDDRLDVEAAGYVKFQH